MEYRVSDEDAGARLDQSVALQAELSRSQARRWIDEGRVVVNGTQRVASHRVVVGDLIAINPPEPVASSLEPEKIPVPILFEDSHVVVVDKPAGLVVHPAPGHPSGTLVNALLFHCGDLAGIGGVLRPGIVHRLDRGTSGVMVVAKHDAAHAALSAQFHDHTIERMYRALVRGVPREDEGRIDQPIGRHAKDRKRMSVAAPVSRAAQTVWHVKKRFLKSERTWLEVLPETGRTHQIRVHLSSVGLPLVGDPVYGRRGRKLPEGSPGRPALHAERLGFVHPSSGERVQFQAPLPEDLVSLLAKLERREDAVGC